MDNVVGAKAAYPIYGNQTITRTDVVLDSVNVGTFICALLYLPHIGISKIYSLIPFITIAPEMSSTYFPIYNLTDGTMTSSETTTERIAIRVYSTTDTIILRAVATGSSGYTATINGCIVILA